jgi:predicted alpha/beta superfamily hydrolase
MVIRYFSSINNQMKKILLATGFISALSMSGLKAQNSQSINIGTIDTIYSKILGEQRTVWVYVPNAGANEGFAKVKYPVIYVFDGDIAFSSVTGMTQFLSSIPMGICPEVIVVGIMNKHRFKDLTPTHVESKDPDVNASGGGENVLAYVEKEVMPYIDKTYPTLPYKALIGHSLGGLMVMQAFTHHYNAYNAYVPLDPSMWWDKQKLLKEIPAIVKNANLNDRPLYLGIANTMEPGTDTSSVQKDTSISTIHIRSILALNKQLQATKKNYTSKYYGDYDHGSSFLPSTYDALLWLFKDYALDNLRPIDFSSTYVDTLRKKIEAHYAKFSAGLGFTYTPPEKIINKQATNAANRKQIEAAEYLFKLNVANYPTSFHAHDAMGSFYKAQNNKNKAIEYFKKALLIKDVAATRVKLRELEMK